MKAKITTFIFLLLLGAITVVNLAVPSKSYSENENRYLAQMPAFSFSALFDGSFTTDFESYVTDQFAFRDAWVGVKTISEMALQKKDSGGVYFAKDHYLIEMFDSIDQEQYEKNLKHVADFSQRMVSAGLSVHTMLVPTAGSVYRDKLPAYAPEVDQDALFDQAAAIIPGIIDVRETLKNHTAEYLYYRTDHHWTSLGCYYAYQHWREENEAPARALSWYCQEPLTNTFFGTTYSKANLYTAKPDTITAFLPGDGNKFSVSYNNGQMETNTLYERSYLEKKDKYSVFLNGNQPITKITSENKNGKKLLLIKDSYANTFAQFAACDFEEVILIDLRHYKTSLDNLVEQEGITDILILYNMQGFSSDTNLFLLNQNS